MRTVPNGQQSGLRVIVLFTDGAPNSVPGIYPGSSISRGLRTADFPKRYPDPDNMTWDSPGISGLFDTQSGAAAPNYTPASPPWNTTTAYGPVPLLPLTSFHSYHRSGGIPTSFPLVSNAVMVDGAPQTSRRPMRGTPVGGRYPTQTFNINNASRNLVEIIANEARNDTSGDYRIRIYTIGMGTLVRMSLGTRPETSESMLKRVANDATSPDFIPYPGQLEGKYYYAETAAHVAAAFQALQNEIIRLTK